MAKLGAAIIGCGAIFPIHAKAIKENSNSDLICVVDIDEKKGKKMAMDYHCDYYRNYGNMLKDSRVNVVHICTPHYLHERMIIDSVHADKHVIVEKPFVLNINEAEIIANELQDTNKIIGVSFQNRYNPSSIKIKQIIDNKELGSVLGIKAFVTWMRDSDYYLKSNWRGKFTTEGGGLLINQAIHTLDLMQWFGGDIVSIKGHVDTRCLNDVIEVEDTAEATIKFKNGAVGLFYGTNGYSTNSPVELEVHLENGTLKMINGYLLLFQNNKIKTLVKPDEIEGNKAYWGASHKILINNAYESIFNNSNDYITIKDASISLKMIKGIYESSRTNKIFYL